MLIRVFYMDLKINAFMHIINHRFSTKVIYISVYTVVLCYVKWKRVVKAKEVTGEGNYLSIIIQFIYLLLLASLSFS